MSGITPSDFDRIKALLPQSDAEAEERYNKFKSCDPFPEIAPALLNSADFIDYIIATGMICPFHLEKSKLKPASYAVSLLGQFVYWDEEGEIVNDEISEGKIFVLKKNSIAFVTLEPFFRLPEYIALRFNLKIKNVYRGLLLGTGPLVDPGFKGRLPIPLHNLTTNDYTFRGGEDIIYFEFTKLSPNDRWNKNKELIRREGEYVQFEERKIIERQSIIDYTLHAASGKPIRSSIPESVRIANEMAKKAAKSSEDSKNTTEKLSKKTTLINFLSLGAIVIAAVSLIATIISINNATNEYIRNVQRDTIRIREELSKQYFNELLQLKNDLNLLKSSIDSVKTANIKPPK